MTTIIETDLMAALRWLLEDHPYKNVKEGYHKSMDYARKTLERADDAKQAELEAWSNLTGLPKMGKKLPMKIVCGDCNLKYTSYEAGSNEDERLKKAVMRGVHDNDWSGLLCYDCLRNKE